MIKFNDLQAQWNCVKEECNRRISTLHERSNYILGDDVEQFEQNFSKFIGCKYAIGVNSGTDAITLALRAILDLYTQKNHKGLIITQANTYIATVLAIYNAKLDYNFDVMIVDCDEYGQINIKEVQSLLEYKRVEYRYCIVIPAHMYGACANMNQLLQLSIRYNFYILEDSAQAHGTITNTNRKTGNNGLVSAFSFYPGKNLGACGDGGAITTNIELIYRHVLKLRNMGSFIKHLHTTMGFNSRLDSIQAIILDEKLKFLDKWNTMRQKVAQIYSSNLDNVLQCPPYCNNHTYHLYIMWSKNRDELIKHLTHHQIPTGIHYPKSIDQHDCLVDIPVWKSLYNAHQLSKMSLSLPIHPFLHNPQHIINMINLGT